MGLRALIINGKDNVANLIGAGKKGQSVECTTEGRQQKARIVLRDNIPLNHKFAAVDIRAGETIVKYGFSIGRASCNIRKGQCVHVHNIESNRGRGDLRQAKP